MPLTIEQRRSLDDDGYFLVRGALDAGLLARLRLAFATAPKQNDGTQHVRLTNDTPELSAWRTMDRVPVVLDAAWHILGRSFAVRDLHGRNPLPGFGQQGLHADAPPWSVGDAPAIVTVLWMIDPFTEKNGATRVVPASHKYPGQVPRAFAQPLSRHPAERVIEGEAGDALILNGRLWHSGRRNDTSSTRRAGQMIIQVESRSLATLEGV